MLTQRHFFPIFTIKVLSGKHVQLFFKANTHAHTHIQRFKNDIGYGHE